MRTSKVVAATIAAGTLLSACMVAPPQPNACCTAQADARQATLPAPARKILAVGHGAVGTSSSQQSIGQQKLMAQRAARVDAYRNLAEQVYGFRVWGNTAVTAFASQNDGVRTYVDAFIRGARFVSMTAAGDGSYEATVELELTPTFVSCVSNSAGSACSVPAAGPAANAPVAQSEAQCAMPGCVQPSAYYYTAQ